MLPHIVVQAMNISDAPYTLSIGHVDKTVLLRLIGLVRKIASVTNTHQRKSDAAHAMSTSHRQVKQGLQATLSHAIVNDGTTLQDALESLYLRLRVTLASQFEIIKGKTVQSQYNPSELFTLEKWGDEYRMVNAVDGVLSGIDGLYLFIIPFDSPYQIQCAALAISDKATSRMPHKGHSSFSNITRVHFAGVIKFVRRQVVFWSNASGHFMPPAEARHAMLPYLKLLLPESRFVEHRFLLSGSAKLSSATTAAYCHVS